MICNYQVSQQKTLLVDCWWKMTLFVCFKTQQHLEIVLSYLTDQDLLLSYLTDQDFLTYPFLNKTQVLDTLQGNSNFQIRKSFMRKYVILTLYITEIKITMNLVLILIKIWVFAMLMHSNIRMKIFRIISGFECLYKSLLLFLLLSLE